MPRFPRRTVILMVLSLFAFAWMWLQTHRQPAPHPTESPMRATPIELIAVPSGGDR